MIEMAPLSRTFRAVATAGKLHLTAPKAYADHIATFADGIEYDITISEHHPRRSLDQNAYLHAEPLPKIMQGIEGFRGMSPAQVKLVLLGLHFGWTKGPSGQTIPVEASTSDLSRAQFTQFLEWLIHDYGPEHHLNIVPPEPDPVKRDPRVTVTC